MITDEIKQYAMGLLATNPLYKDIVQDVGVLAVMDSLTYKIDARLRDYANVIAEYYSPENEAVLLSHLLYRIAYIKFKKPMIVQAKIKENATKIINQDEVFTDGISSYLVHHAVSCIGGIPTDIEFIQAHIRNFQKTVSDVNLYTHIPTGIYYQDIYKIVVTVDDIEIPYSQQFIDKAKDVSYEVAPDSTISIVVRNRNTNGSNISTNDVIKVKVYVSQNITIPPENLSVVASGFNLIVTNIVKTANYSPALTKEDMRDILRYNKNIANTMTFNEDYYQLVHASPIRGITGLKVWQQREQEMEQHGDTCWINKVWFCFTLETETAEGRTQTENEITSLVYSTTEGKYPVFVTPNIISLVVTLEITNNISKKIPLEVQKKIVDDLKGIYDDKYKKISKTIAYRSVFENLRAYNTDIDLNMTDKRSFHNNNFYEISTVDITITERGW